MGKLMLNGIDYTGGGGGSGDLTAVELTKAQYDALTQAQKEDTTKLYMVTDYSPGGGGGESGDLEDLGDVNITSPTNGQVLTYDSASQKWINAAGGSGGGSKTMLYSRQSGDSEDTITLSEDFDHFDLLVISGRAYIDSGLWHQSNAYICDSLAVGNRIAIGDDGSISWFNIYNKTTLTRASNSGNPYQITHVMGVKLNGGGGAEYPHEIVRQRNVYCADGTSITLNLTKKYTNPYVMPCNIVPLSSWGGLVVIQDTSVISYDSSNDTVTFLVYTNGAQYFNIDWNVFEESS